MAGDDLKKTPLYEEHKALGARLVPFAGWEMPVQYEGIKKEHQAVRERAGLFDVCHMGELELRGPDAVAAVDALVTNDVANLAAGKALYTLCCNEQGGILDDLIIYKRGDDRVMVVCNAANHAKISKHFAERVKDRCEFDDRTDETALIALQGPRAEKILAAAGASDTATGLGAFEHTEGRVGDAEALIARTGYTGEDGFELYCASNDAPAVWRALMKAGEPEGIAPAGLGARDTLRLEAKLMLYGNDIDESTNPYEARLGWVVKLDKGEFVGRDALRAIKEQGPSRKLVGFEMTGRGIARHDYPILDEHSEKVGIVTSGSPGPTVDKNIGLGYVPAEMAKVGTRIGIEIRGKVVDAVIVKTPFYKRSK